LLIQDGDRIDSWILSYNKNQESYFRWGISGSFPWFLLPWHTWLWIQSHPSASHQL